MIGAADAIYHEEHEGHEELRDSLSFISIHGPFVLFVSFVVSYPLFA